MICLGSITVFSAFFYGLLPCCPCVCLRACSLVAIASASDSLSLVVSCRFVALLPYDPQSCYCIHS